MIDVNSLTLIGEYFRFRWDPPILAELAEGPSRFRALATRLQTRVGGHLDDNVLTRSLARLARRGLVTAGADCDGRRAVKVYQLTPKGHERVATYQILATVLASTSTASGTGTAGTGHAHTATQASPSQTPGT